MRGRRPRGGFAQDTMGFHFSSLLCSSEQRVRAQDKRIAELTRPDMEAQLNPTPITGFRRREDETELQWALRLNDMMDAKSEEVEAKRAQIEEVEEAIRRRQQQEGIEYERVPSPLKPLGRQELSLAKKALFAQHRSRQARGHNSSALALMAVHRTAG